MPKLPPIELRCRFGHVFTTCAHGDQSVKCTVCLKLDGTRTSVHVPKARPTSAAPQPQGTAASALLGIWGSEPRFSETPITLTPDENLKCGYCGNPVTWDVSRTVLLCDPCEMAPALDPAVKRRYDEARKTKAAKAPAERPNRQAQIRERVELASHKSQIQAACLRMVQKFDPEGLPEYLVESSHGWRARFQQLHREVGTAQNDEELTEALAVAQQLTAESENMQFTVDSARKHVAYALERQQPAALPVGRGYIAPQEDEDEDEDEEYEEPRARVTEPTTLPITTMVDQTIAMAAMLRRNRKEQLARGVCGFRHFRRAPADYVFQGSTPPNYNGRVVAQSEPVLCCKKHYSEAEQELASHGWENITYWELSA